MSGGTDRTDAGRITVQCTNVPPGASGSSTTIATRWAEAGTARHVIGGGTFSPSHVYLAGMRWPSAKASLDTSMSGIVVVSGDDVPAPVEHPAINTTRTAQRRIGRDSRTLTWCAWWSATTTP